MPAVVMDDKPVPDRAGQAGTGHDQKLDAKLQDLFRNSPGKVFDDYLTAEFGNALSKIILEHGVAAVKRLGEMALAPDAPVDVAEGSMQQIGLMRDAVTHHARLSLLERALESQNDDIRDGAVIGLGDMGDARALPSLERALERETSTWIGPYLQYVIACLRTGQSTRNN